LRRSRAQGELFVARAGLLEELADTPGYGVFTTPLGGSMPGKMGELSPRRRDDEGEWHDLVPTECPHCGCGFFVAEDDESIVWDPGRAWEDDCADRDCHCHSEPVVGMRRETGPGSESS
jgi:hypothetical protein